MTMGRRRLPATQSQAYHAGRLAMDKAWEGLPALANPYPPTSPEHTQFERGRQDVQAENS